MLLYNQLLHISDQKDLATAQWMESESQCDASYSMS